MVLLREEVSEQCEVTHCLQAAEDQRCRHGPAHRIDQTAGSFTVTDRHENGGRPGNEQWQDRKHQGLPSVQHTHIFKSLDALLSLTGLQAGRAVMLAFQLAITERTKKATARIAGQDRLFFRMIEAARLAIDHYSFTSSRGRLLAEQCREDFNL